MQAQENFFHSCWLTMKAERPLLQKYMLDLELRLAGLSDTQQYRKQRRNKNSDTPRDDKPSELNIL